MENMFHEVETSLSPAEASERIQEAAKENKFGVINVLNLTEIMAGKGVEYDGAAIVIEICQPGYAKKFLEVEPTVATCLPCRVSVTSKGGKTIVHTIRPENAFAMFNVPGLEPLAKEVAEILNRIMEAVA